MNGETAVRAAATGDATQVTRLTRDVVVHDLAAESGEVLSGVFTPARSRVELHVQAAYSFMGNSRGALLLYVGQPEVAGSRLFDSGAAPLPGVQWFSVGSVNGECAWANTTGRRVVVDVEPGRPVTWQILLGIIGGSQTLHVPGARRIAITPDGGTAWVTSPEQGIVTPIALGRPGYSYEQSRNGMDELRAPLDLPHCTHVATGDAHAVVSQGAQPRVSILSVADRAVVGEVPVAAGVPQGAAVSTDGGFAVVATDAGSVLRVALPGGACDVATAGERLVDAAVSEDGTVAYLADAGARAVHRLRVADLAVEQSLAMPATPVAVRVAADGRVWVLCGGDASQHGRIVGIDPQGGGVVHDWELPFAEPVDMALIPVAGQSTDAVRTAWVMFAGGRYCEFNIGGVFAGMAHSIHCGAFGDGIDAGGVAVNDYGEIWVTQPSVDSVFKWIGGRFQCRAGLDRPYPGIFFGEYCEVLVDGAAPGEA